MSVNGVTGATNTTETYRGYTNTATKKTETKTQENTNGVVYEPSKEIPTEKKTYQPNAALVAKMKADADARTSQLKTLVTQMMTKQGQTLGETDSIWSFLAKGKLNVDPAAVAQAKADIAEDGYWGVSQTSDRIIDFATALTGGNPEKVEEMRDAFVKGFKQATRTWGDKLPDLSQKTYQAVMDKFDKLAGKTNEVITE